MSQLAAIYAQLDNIVSKHMDTNTLDELDEEFQAEYFSLRDEILSDLSNLLMPQYNFDTSISLETKNEIIQLLNIYYDTTELLNQYPIDDLVSVQGRLENLLIDKYMYLYGFKRNNMALWEE